MKTNIVKSEGEVILKLEMSEVEIPSFNSLDEEEIVKPYAVEEHDQDKEELSSIDHEQ